MHNYNPATRPVSKNKRRDLREKMAAAGWVPQPEDIPKEVRNSFQTRRGPDMDDNDRRDMDWMEAWIFAVCDVHLVKGTEDQIPAELRKCKQSPKRKRAYIVAAQLRLGAKRSRLHRLPRTERREDIITAALQVTASRLDVEARQELQPVPSSETSSNLDDNSPSGSGLTRESSS